MSAAGPSSDRICELGSSIRKGRALTVGITAASAARLPSHRVAQRRQ